MSEQVNKGVHKFQSQKSPKSTDVKSRTKFKTCKNRHETSKEDANRTQLIFTHS